MARVTVNQLIEALEAVADHGHGGENIILAPSGTHAGADIAVSPQPGEVLRIASAGFILGALEQTGDPGNSDITLVIKPDRLRQLPEQMTLGELRTAISWMIAEVPGSADRPVVIRAFPDATGDALAYDLAIDVTDADAAPGSFMTYGLGLRLGRA